MKYLLIPIAVTLILFSCKKEKQMLSIDKEKLVDILSDMHVAEEMIGKFREEDKDSVRNLFMEEITTLHQIDTSTIFTEIRLIQDHPELGLEIYSEVYTRLEKYGKTYDKTNKSNKKDKSEKSNKSKDKTPTKIDDKKDTITDVKSEENAFAKSNEKDK